MCGLLRAPGWRAGPAALTGHAKGGQRQRGRTWQALKDRNPEIRAEGDSGDKGSPETAKGRDIIRKRKTGEGGRRQELVRVAETTYLDNWQGRTDSQKGPPPERVCQRAGGSRRG